MQASITVQHNTLNFFCLYRPPPNRRNNLTDSMFTEQLPDLLDYVNNLIGFVCLVGAMNNHFDNPLQSLAKQTFSSYLNSHNLYNACQSAYRPGHSTETALLKVVNDLFLSLNNGNKSVLALHDFSSALDTIYHPIIVHRLNTAFDLLILSSNGFHLI